ncbi:MAG: ribonuclease P protein component [Aquabacterium sp.]|nr:ribonuclease P protein component [Ferruginibacter sp.]
MEGFFNFAALELKTRYTLGKNERLKSRKVIDLLFKEGKSFTVFPFRVLYTFEEGAPGLKAGFTASSRNFKKAVDRNRIKRLSREAYRLQKNELQHASDDLNRALAIFVIYIDKELPEYKMVFEKMTLVLKRLIKITGENN